MWISGQIRVGKREFFLCMTCGNVGVSNYICKEIEACKTLIYILTKFPVKPVQILKSDRFCGIIKLSYYTHFQMPTRRKRVSSHGLWLWVCNEM